MRLISCYIENFGTLSQFTYEFEEGLNIIEEENGWGKTTFAAFIKAMFYGLDYTWGKRITDRKLYIPWNGNKFGGYIIFEMESVEYKIERFFGKREQEDTITVYNMSKNLITDELGDNPGEIIWGVDRDSYEKTAFITLKDSNLLNDIISSKLGDIDDKEADLETSSKAVDLLEEEIVNIRARRGKNGILDIKQENVRALKQDLRQYNSALEKMGKTEEWIQVEKRQLEKIGSELEKIEEEQSKLLLYEKKQQHLNLIKDFNEKQNQHRENEEFFKNKDLTEEALNRIKEEANKYTNRNEQLENTQLSEIEEKELKELSYKFKEGVPSSLEIEKCNEKIVQLSNRRIELDKYSMSIKDMKRYNKLTNKYKDVDIDGEMIEGYLNDVSEISRLEKEESEINIELGQLSQTKEKEKSSPLILGGLTAFILGIVVLMVSPIIGSILAVIGAVILVVSLAKKPGDKEEKSSLLIEKRNDLKNRLITIEEEKSNLKSGYSSFLKTIGEKTHNITLSLANAKAELAEHNRFKEMNSYNTEKREKIEKDISQLETEINLFISKYNDSSIKKTYERELSELRESLARFNELSKKGKSYKETEQLVEESKEILEDEFQYYYEKFPKNITVAVNELNKKHYDLKSSEKSLEESKANKDKFKSENNILELEKVILPDTPNNKFTEDLRKEKDELDQQKSEIIRTIERYKKDINLLSQEVDKIEDTESTITRLEIEIEELEKRYELLTITKECMNEAKENLATKYMGSMAKSFEKYLSKLNDGIVDPYEIDINLDIKVEHEGQLQDGSQLSQGMRDLTQLCMRMALVEAVYKDVEKPILVLDDPFINLDNKRLENAIDLLKDISLEYQIIYFICHDSRSVEIA